MSPSVSETSPNTPNTPDQTSIRNNLRTASEDERSKLIGRLTSTASTCRRIPLPPRHHIRPRNVSPQKHNLASECGAIDEEDDVDEEDEEEFGERRNATSIVEETAEFSNELRDMMVRLKNGSGGTSCSPSPTPFRYSASYIWWGYSGAGVELAAQMVRKGEDAFAWRYLLLCMSLVCMSLVCICPLCMRERDVSALF